MKIRRRRPLTKRVLTCIKHCGYIEYIGEHTYLPADAGQLCYYLNIKPRQLTRAVCQLRKRGKLAPRDYNSIYRLPMTLGEWGIKQAWFSSLRQEINDTATANEVDALLRLRQRTENNLEN